MSVTALNTAKFPVKATPMTPLRMIQAEIIKAEARLTRLRDKERIAQRWDMDDRAWDVLKPR